MKIIFTYLILVGALLGTVTGTDCTQNNDCTEQGFVCKNGICECGDGYFQSGISECSEVATIYGSTCSNEFHCRLLNNSRCDFEGNCRCLPGFVFMATHCIKVLGTGCSVIDCSLLVNSVCGDKNSCEYEEGFSDNNNVCSDQNCNDVISILPNLPERFSSFNMSLEDPLISDHLLKEGWYRTEDHYMPTIDSGAKINSFGTYYPIVVSGSDPDYFANLTEIEKSLVAVVVGNTYSSEEIEIKVRRCPDGFHYYLKPPKTRPAAYGFLSNHDGRIFRKIDDWSSSQVKPHLRFYQEETEEGLKDIPFAVWECRSYRNNIISDAFVGTLWYVNDRLIQTKGPIIQRTTDEDLDVYKVSELELTEFEFMASGGSIGSTLRCAIAYTVPEMYGEYVMDGRSKSYRLEFLVNEHSAIDMYEDNNQSELYIMANFGLGCSTLVTSKETHCYIKLKIKPPDDQSACYLDGTTETDDPTICEIVIPVWTKFGLEHTGSTQCDRLPSHMTINGTKFYDSYYLLVMLQQANNIAEALRTKMRIRKTDFIGQPLFDIYKVPPLEVIILPSTVWSTYYWYSLQLYNQDLQWETGSWDNFDSGTIHFSQEGVYLLLRSTTHIFQVHVELRYCDELKLCFCGVQIQYRKDIYMYYVCGGLMIDEFVYGNGESIYLYKYSNGFTAELKHVNYMPSWFGPMGIPIYVHNNQQHGMSMSFENVGETTSLEGIYPASNELQGRDGKVYKNDSDFLNTWRVSDEESLFNPANYRQYRIIDEYAACGCPTSTVNITNPEVTYESDTYINRKVYTGTIQCQLDNICSDIIEGEVWKPSIFPDYIIKTASVTTMLTGSQDTSLALVFRCEFHTVEGHKYIITWFVNDVLIKESDPLPTDTAESFTLIDEEIFNSSKVDFFLDMKVQCSANVLDYQENVLVAPVISQPFHPFQIVSNEITLIRGRSASVSVNVNIQVCANSSLCNLDIQIVDTSETHSCADSTLAMVGDSGCGTSINGLSLSSTSSDGIVATSTITTKNNNKYRLKTSYDLKVKAVWSGAVNSTSIWNGFLNDTARVTVQDIFTWQGQSCYDHIDPHFRTFDGRYYDIHLMEEYVMLRHTREPIEIQTVVRPCYESKYPRVPHCSCAVTVRAGSDVFTINHCDGQHITAFLSKGDNVLKVYSRNIKFHQIRLPTGMLVNVYVIPWGTYVLNIDIYPTPADVDSIVGLCGTFNGDTHDDFKMRNGSITNNPVQFGLSWGLNNTNKSSEESLRLKKNYENQSPWKRETKLCVCPDPNSSHGGAICSANEEDTCSSPIKHKGDQLLSNTRLKRDTTHINLDLDRRMKLQTQNLYKPDDRVKRSLDNVLSLDTAREMCEKAFANCLLSLIEGTPVDPVQNIEECALDTAVTGTLEWFPAHCEAFGLALEQELEKDVEYTEQNPEIAVYTSQVLDCSDCSGNGECVNGTCHCYSGFGSDICLVNLSRIVEVTYIFGDGFCDISVDGSCQDFIVESDGFVPEFSARVNVLTASKDGYFKDKGTQVGETTYLSFNEGIVSISGIENQTATPANDTVLAQQFGISVSNNGVDFGNPRHVTVYNSKCQEISYSSNDSIVVILKNDTCFIDGTCYIEDERSPSNECLVCRSSASSNFDWTAEDCDSSVTEDPSATSDPSVTGDTSASEDPSTTTDDSSVTSAPSATDDPSATSDLSVTGDTSATSAPSATDDTSATSDPSVTGDTSATSDPSVTGDTSATSSPSATDDPSATSSPSVTGDTFATRDPSVTDDSSATSDPSVTDDSSATSDPSVTGDSSATSDPSVTGDTSATSDPSATGDLSVTKDPSVTGDEVSVYVIILIVLGILFLVGATAVVIMMRRYCSSKPAAPSPSVPDRYAQQPRIYSIEDDDGKEDRISRKTDVEQNRLPRYMLEPAAQNPSVPNRYTQQPRIYSIEDDNSREEGLNRETYVERNRLPRYVLD